MLYKLIIFTAYDVRYNTHCIKLLLFSVYIINQGLPT